MERITHPMLALCFGGLMAMALILAISTRSPVHAGTTGVPILVPEDYPTIQAAVDATVDGDTILVATGSYMENISITKGITLSGGWDSTFSVRQIGDSTVDGQGLGRVISITCSSSEMVVTIDGFTIMNGDASGLGAANLPEFNTSVSLLTGAEKRPVGPDDEPMNPAQRATEIRSHLMYLNHRSLYPGGTNALQSMLDELECRATQAEHARALANSGFTLNNYAPNQGPGDGGGGIYSWNASLHLLNSTIVDNVASQDSVGAGGGVYVGQAATDGVLIAGNVFVRNTASASENGAGGGLYVYQTPGVIIEDNNFVDNVSSAGGYDTQGQGGGMEIDSSTDAIVRSNRIERNTANASWDAHSGAGGGIHLQDSPGAEISDNILRSNMASMRNHGNGGGLFLFESENVVIESNTMAENWAVMFGEENINGGGALLVHADGVVFTANTVDGNTAGLYIQGLMGDYCLAGGFLIAFSNFPQVTDNTISNNVCNSYHHGDDMDGIAHGGGGALSITYEAVVSGNTFNNNVSSLSDMIGDSGGLYVDGTTNSHITGNLFQENRGGTEGEGSGGALGLIGWSSVNQNTTVDGNLFLNNQASAAIEFIDSSSSGASFDTLTTGSTFINNVIAGNTAGQGGGIVLNATQQSKLINNTLVDNSENGVIVDTPHIIEFVNNIIVSHTVGISVTSGSTAVIGYTLWHGNGTDIDGAGVISHTHQITGTPAFVDPALDDYRLSMASAAIDAGDPAGVPPAPDHDADDVSRPQGLRVDIGAYEWQGHRFYFPIIYDKYPTIGWAVGDSVDGYGAILKTIDGGTSWARQGSPVDIPDSQLKEVSAVDAQHAWIVGAYAILCTRNGGQTWETQTLPSDLPAGFEFMGIKALDANTVFVVGNPSLLLNTTDGSTWLLMPVGSDVPGNVNFQVVDAVDASHVWAVGATMVEGNRKDPVTTFYNGISWHLQPTVEFADPMINAYIGISVIDRLHAWAVGGWRMPLVSTANGGATWHATDHPLSGGDMNRVVAVSPTTGWTAGDYGNVLYTTDAGATWYDVSLPSAFLFGITAIDDRTAWVVGSGVHGPPPGIIARTWDSLNWEVLSDPSWPNMNGISFVGARR